MVHSEYKYGTSTSGFHATHHGKKKLTETGIAVQAMHKSVDRPRPVGGGIRLGRVEVHLDQPGHGISYG